MKKFRYVYEYTSPFGENWRVDKRFGFLWLTHSRPYDIGVYDFEGIKKYVRELEYKNKKGQIISDIDPYGEEDWDE